MFLPLYPRWLKMEFVHVTSSLVRPLGRLCRTHDRTKDDRTGDVLGACWWQSG